MIRIRGGTVVTMNAARVVHTRADVVVGDDGSIAGVGPGAPPPGKTPDEEIDAAGKIVIPGLVQTHVHVCQTLYRNRADDLDLLRWLRERIWPYEASLDAAAMRASARLGFAELLRNGTTSVLDMGSVRHYDEVFQAASECGMRLTGGKCLMDTGESVPPALLEKSRAGLDESVALAKRWHRKGDGRLRYAFAPRFALSCTEGLLKDVSALSLASGILVHTHASEQLAECQLVRQERDADAILYLDKLGISGPRACLAHCVHPTPRELALLAEAQTRVLHCPSSNLKLGSGIAPIPEMLRAGVPVSLGADGAACNNLLDPWEEMRLAALVQKARVGPTAMPAETVFGLATMGGARALGLESQIGSIVPGKRADLVIVDPRRLHSSPPADVYSMLVYSTRSEQVDTVLVDGKVLVRSGELAVWDEAQVRSEAKEAVERVAAKL